jgi:hypothetical protein
MAAFPSLRPSERALSIGQPPIKEYRALNGIVVRRSFGNQRFNYQLTLSFNNIPEVSLSAIWDHYHDNLNIANGFSVPDSIFSGYRTNEAIGRNEGFISRVNRMANIAWRYAEPPQVESVFGSYSTVQVVLVGELRYIS